MRFRQLFLAAALVAAFVAPAVQAQVVFQDNFDSNPLKLDAAPAGWSLSGEGKVNLIGSSNAPGSEPGIPDLLPGNGVYIDLIGTNGAPGNLVSPTFALGVGIEYTVTFALAGNQASGVETVRVNFGDTEAFYDIAATDGFSVRTLTFTPASAADYSISFTTTAFNGGPPNLVGPGGSGRGALLDALTITAVPEPSTYALLLVGLIGLHVVARRRIQQ